MQQYENNEEFRIFVRSLASLSLLPVANVQHGFDMLMQRAPQASMPIFEYFRRYFVMITINSAFRTYIMRAFSDQFMGSS